MDLWQDVRYALRRLIEDRWFALVAVVASLVPARRSTGIDPMEALGIE